MNNIDLKTLKSSIDQDLDAQIVSGRILLDRLSVIEDSSRKTAAYLDHKYAPFYYHLGKYTSPDTVVEIGFDLGLLSSSFFSSCKTTKRFFGFKEPSKDFVPTRLGKSNIRMVFRGEAKFYNGSLHEEEFSDVFSPNPWDLVILNEETVYDKHLEYLDAVWPRIGEHGLVIAEYIDRHAPARDAFFAFCESKNRQPIIFETRYGTGILQK